MSIWVPVFAERNVLAYSLDGFSVFIFFMSCGIQYVFPYLAYTFSVFREFNHASR